MKLFGKKTKNIIAAKQEPIIQPAYRQKFIQSKSFRGHKRFHVSYYGYKLAEQGIATLRNYGMDLDDADIVLSYYNDKRLTVPEYVEVRVNGCLVGSVWLTDPQVDDYIKKYLLTGRVKSAYVRVEYETIIYTNDDGELDSMEREKISLFLKATE